MSRIVVKPLFNVDRPGWLDSDLVRLKTGGVTIDSSQVSADASGKKIVRSGTPVGRVGTTQKYAPADGVNITAEFLTLTDCDVTDGDAEVAVIDWGRVIKAALPVTITPAIASQLSGITFV